jgi:hypothetical protein
MIDGKELYQLISEKTMRAESVSWSRFHYFLVFNSILILAWTTVYSANPAVDGAAFVLPLICSLGIISGLLWAGLGFRSRVYLNEYIAQGKTLENDNRHWPSELSEVKPCTTEAGRHPLHACCSTVILTVIPLAILLTHAGLLIVSLDLI